MAASRLTIDGAQLPPLAAYCLSLKGYRRVTGFDPDRSDASDRNRGGRGCSLRNSALELANPVSVSNRILAIYIISHEFPQRSGERVG
jgi:hypothetical protein